MIVILLRDHTEGFEALSLRVKEYPPEKVEGITGVARETIRRFAAIYAGSSPSFIYAGSGMQHHTNGGMMIRTISCLPRSGRGVETSWRWNVLSYQRSFSCSVEHTRRK